MRVFAAVFGGLLLGTGIYAAAGGAVEAVWGYIGGFTLMLLSGNAIYAAIADKRPWVFRVGPLP